jgi:glucose-6-phosphate 1-epimerase
MNHPTPLDLPALNTRFAIPGHLRFMEIAPGLPIIDIQTPLATARVALQGGQVLAWRPDGVPPVLWLSGAAVFQPGRAVRGGIPVCWPWFGERAGHSAHGFVRTRLWDLRDTRLDAAGQVCLSLGLQDDAATRAVWNHAFDLELQVTVGTTLRLLLTTRNTGPHAFTLTEALHTYFSVGDIRQTTVQGLDGTHYLDKVHGFTPAQQLGPVHFTGETDRVYLNTTADCVINDADQQRRITVAKTGSHATVVWNPWTEREKTLGDMATGGYQRMVCVETANAGGQVITVAPGESHGLSAMISVATCDPGT